MNSFQQIIFQQILDMRSMTAIHYRAEDALMDYNGPARTALEAIMATNVLDEIYIIAHMQLGQHEEAEVLRKWLADAPKRKPTFSDLLDD